MLRRRRLERKALRLARLLCELDERARDARRPRVDPRTTSISAR